MVNSAAYAGPVGICRIVTIVLGIISAVVITIGRASLKSLSLRELAVISPYGLYGDHASSQSLQIIAFLVAILSVIWLILLLVGIIPNEIACLIIDIVFHTTFLFTLGGISLTNIYFGVYCGEIEIPNELNEYNGRYEREKKDYSNDQCTYTVCDLVARLLELCNAGVYAAVAALDLIKLVQNQNTNSNQT